MNNTTTTTAYWHNNSLSSERFGDASSVHAKSTVYLAPNEYAREIRKYRTEIPNIVFEKGLTGDQIALYAHIKRRAGGKEGGECTEGLRGIARTLKRSKDSVSRDLAILVEQDLVEAGDQPRRDRPRPVTVTNIWPENYERFSGKRLMERKGLSRPRYGVSQEEDKGVPLEGRKKKPIKKEPAQNGTSEEGATAPGAGSDKSNLDHKEERNFREELDHVIMYLASWIVAKNIPFTSQDRIYYREQFAGPVEATLAHKEGSTEREALRQDLQDAADRIVERFADYKLSYEDALEDVRRVESRDCAARENEGLLERSSRLLGR